MIKLNIRSLATATGINNPLVFSKQSGLAYAMCYKLWNDQQTRIDLATIDRLCSVFRCSPGDLFLRDSAPAGSPGTHDEETGSRLSAGAQEPAAITCRRIRWID